MSRYGRLYTVRLSKKYLVGYRCSKCGGRNLFYHPVKVVGQSKLDDNYVTSSITQRMYRLAENQANERLVQKVEMILSEQKRGSFRTAEYCHKCEHCRHKEAWSKMRFSRWKEWAFVIGLWGPIAAFFAFFAGVAVGLAVLAGVGAIVGVPFVVNRILLTKREQQIAELPPMSMPMMTLDPQNPEFLAHLGC